MAAPRKAQHLPRETELCIKVVKTAAAKGSNR